ncbi:hypothetical protein BJ170DRAFT_641534 [Xylariales sp. AK1849]|nr:hypothetical protein BJ170DRAFT_641534 [Xylariales sp. AK1849]
MNFGRLHDPISSRQRGVSGLKTRRGVDSLRNNPQPMDLASSPVTSKPVSNSSVDSTRSKALAPATTSHLSKVWESHVDKIAFVIMTHARTEKEQRDGYGIRGCIYMYASHIDRYICGVILKPATPSLSNLAPVGEGSNSSQNPKCNHIEAFTSPLPFNFYRSTHSGYLSANAAVLRRLCSLNTICGTRRIPYSSPVQRKLELGVIAMSAFLEIIPDILRTPS